MKNKDKQNLNCFVKFDHHQQKSWKNENELTKLEIIWKNN